MGDISLFTAIMGACSPFFLTLFTWITRRGLEKRAAEETTLDRRLAAQREDFNAVVAPLSESIKRLREDNDKLNARVDDLDKRLDAAESDASELIFDFRRTLDHIDRAYGDPGPKRSARVNELLGFTP